MKVEEAKSHWVRRSLWLGENETNSTWFSPVVQLCIQQNIIKFKIIISIITAGQIYQIMKRKAFFQMLIGTMYSSSFQLPSLSSCILKNKKISNHRTEQNDFVRGKIVWNFSPNIRMNLSNRPFLFILRTKHITMENKASQTLRTEHKPEKSPVNKYFLFDEKTVEFFLYGSKELRIIDVNKLKRKAAGYQGMKRFWNQYYNQYYRPET